MEFTKVIGLDLGDKHTHLCAVDAGDAKVVEKGRLRTLPGDVADYFKRQPPCRVVLEAGAHSWWMQDTIASLGHEVVIANPRKVRMRGATNKNDEVDAEFLARLGRADPTLLYPVKPRPIRVQQALAVVRAREHLVRVRSGLITHVRAVVKTHGGRLPSCSTRTFHLLAELIDESLEPGLSPLMRTLEQVHEQICSLNRQISRLCKEDFPETAKLTQVPGVGELTALTFVLVIDDPHRFENSRVVGAFIGLVPRQRQSGDSNPQLGIHKAGDPILRRILVQCAHYLLGPFGPAGDLRSFGERLLRRGGKSPKKRACVAVARKLATVLHALWKHDAVYDPQHLARAASQVA